MKPKYQTHSLSDLLRRSDEVICLNPDSEYREITVKLWGKGVIERGAVKGIQVAAKQRHIARKGQFILSRIDARNGAMGVVPDGLDHAIVSNDFPVYDIDQAALLPSYLRWLCRTGDFVDRCKQASEGTTNRVRIQEDKFLSTKVALPSLPEQRRIVARIEELAGKIEEARQAKRDIVQKAKGMLHSAFAQVIKDAPLEKIKVVAPLVRRPVVIQVNEKYPELGIRSFGKGTFHKAALGYLDVGTKRLFSIVPGDLLFSNVFAWEGAIAVAHPDDEGRFGSHRFITCVPREGIASAEFLCFYFLTKEGLHKIGKASPGGAGRNRTLGIEKLGEIGVPIPLYGKQAWFNSIQAKVNQMLAISHNTAAELDALIPSILDKAFRGEL